MKQHKTFFAKTLLLAAVVCAATAIAQEGTTLQMQGLNYVSNQSVASHGAGGINIGLKNNPSLMFLNPAELTSISGIQISVGGYQQYLYQKQDRRYGTLQGHAGAVFLLQGITDQIPDPDFSLVTNRRLTQEDSIQRPFDALGPNWNRKRDISLPLQLFVAVPAKVGDVKFTIGLGAVEYANMNWYFQNNNQLSPNILDVTGGTIRTQNLPRNDTVSGAWTLYFPLPVQWNQYIQYRNGSIYGYGGAIAVEVSPRLSLGVSGMLLDGSTTDFEAQHGRGRMLFYYQSIRLDKGGMTSYEKRGKSTYSGYEFTLSGTYKTKYITCGFSIKPPTTITREFSYTWWKDSVTQTKVYDGKTDSVHQRTSGVLKGKDKMELPLRGTVGLTVNVTEKLIVGAEYEIAPYASATYIATTGAKTHPWLSYSLLRLGAEYWATNWLAVRGGVREAAEVFQPATNALRGENVRYPVYSVGFGVKHFGATVNIAYEYANRKYTDTWSNSASINLQSTHTILVEATYELPFIWKLK